MNTNTFQVFFNELSLPVPQHNSLATIKIYKEIIDYIRNNYDCNFTVMTSQPFTSFPLFTQKNNFESFLNKCDKDQQRRLKSLFLNQHKHYELNEVLAECSYSHEGEQNSGGLACAGFFRTFAVSFDTADKWKKTSISLVEQTIKDNSDICNEIIDVPNFSQLNQLVNNDTHKYFSAGIITSNIQLINKYSQLEKPKIEFTEQALDDLAILNAMYIPRLDALICEICSTPPEGKGDPEPLKGDLQGYWSRRINKKDRVVYKFQVDFVQIKSCKGHYS